MCLNANPHNRDRLQLFRWSLVVGILLLIHINNLVDSRIFRVFNADGLHVSVHRAFQILDGHLPLFKVSLLLFRFEISLVVSQSHLSTCCRIRRITIKGCLVCCRSDIIAPIIFSQTKRSRP